MARLGAALAALSAAGDSLIRIAKGYAGLARIEGIPKELPARQFSPVIGKRQQRYQNGAERNLQDDRSASTEGGPQEQEGFETRGHDHQYRLVRDALKLAERLEEITGQARSNELFRDNSKLTENRAPKALIGGGRKQERIIQRKRIAGYDPANLQWLDESLSALKQWVHGAKAFDTQDRSRRVLIADAGRIGKEAVQGVSPVAKRIGSTNYLVANATLEHKRATRKLTIPTARGLQLLAWQRGLSRSEPLGSVQLDSLGRFKIHEVTGRMRSSTLLARVHGAGNGFATPGEIDRQVAAGERRAALLLEVNDLGGARTERAHQILSRRPAVNDPAPTLNYSPTVIINATLTDRDIDRKIIAGLLSHSREISEMLHREMAKQRRTEF
jgi:hypothetical protein